MAAQTPATTDLKSSLAMAMVASYDAPLLLLDGGLSVLAASESFCRTFQVEPAAAVGIPIFGMGKGEWDTPRLRSLLAATLSGSADIAAYEMDLCRTDKSRRQVLMHAHRLAYDDDAANVRLLLTVNDVTDARASDRIKDDLVRDKAVLLQEVQHRVANSLQIIASVLMQSARKVQSEETKIHLHDAHHRVMSIAAVQRQLATSAEGLVALRPYFAQLCQSIGASMIQDHHQLGIDVVVDDSVVSADTTASLGLVVTELVINALKHAFPDGRPGRIEVNYRSLGTDWELSVSDDGVGMLVGPTLAKPGLGTSIVQALAGQLDADISIDSAGPGTIVHLNHRPVNVGANDAAVGPRQQAV